MRRSAEHGFTSSRRSAEHGFTSRRRSAEHGFTLVELMVVIVIIGLLATIVAVNVLPATGKARTEKAKADIATLEQALDQYRLDNITYPNANEGLQALVTAPPTLAQPSRYRPGGYIRRLPNDPWDHPYQYRVPGKRGPFDIVSLGADGAAGGEGENADIYSSDL
ncbi:type II secretion system protein G (GspG) [Hephaestia caeni]|uniref:Type II secretion system core protein G n=1 Tax=Hephaestia caeni TaxID=645617 RepID=A0A397P7R9_9SPHN|nr:type II secretion system major pseudopilin GspG [Hephaestia caeni]RIA45580.1 type II secretion system protein G (GspG) [Hephaestia caeni]